MDRLLRLSRAGLLGLLLIFVFIAISPSAVAKTSALTSLTNAENNLTPQIPGTFLTGPNEGQPMTIALDYIWANRGALKLSHAEVSDLAVQDSYFSETSGVSHFYLIQTHQGIQVHNGILNINIGRDGSVINVGSRIIPYLTAAIDEEDRRLSAAEAVQITAEHLGLESDREPALQAVIGGAAQRVVFHGAGLSRSPIPARLVYQPVANDSVRLAWEVVIHELAQENWWSVRVDAATGQVLDQTNFTVHDNWAEDFEDRVGELVDIPLNATAVPTSYLVYPMPVESPHFAVPAPPADARTAEVSPWLNGASTSPLGWHATTVISWTNTQGNNVDTHKDAVRYDCGPTLECDPPLDLTMEPTTPDNLDAALVNLFYWTNIVHDVTYEYGFDEVAGNFQQDNFGLGGQGSDRLDAKAQAVGSCGAAFGTPPDGSQPTMLITTCGLASPARDGALDNVVVAHEYGHGVSLRLTGGPQNVSCLSNAEQMGEGWADWLGLMLTIESGDTGSDLRTIGTWLFGQGSDGPGVRNYPYTTDFNLNPHTYNDIVTAVSPHDVGEVWATMVWDMAWALIEAHGYNPDFYADWSTGGNNLAFQLVIDGLKFQPCSPGFVDGRDAILLADQNLTGGQNQCLIWQAFADRGLGFSASQGSSNSVFDGVEAFDMPPSCSLLAVQPTSLVICAGDVAEYEVTVGSGFIPDIGLSITGHPADTTATFSPNPVTTVPNTATLTIDNTGGLLFTSYGITITATDSVFTTDNEEVSLGVYDAIPGMVSLTSPPDEATGIILQPSLEWTMPNLATSYYLELDDDPDFNSLVYSATVGSSNQTPTIVLEYDTTYYWRVMAANICGSGPTSNVSSFTTQAQEIGLLERTPDIIEASVVLGNRVTNTLTISNVGSLSLNFTAETGAGWATVTPSSGILTNTQSMNLAVVFDSNQTAGVGTYTSTVTFNGNYGNNPAPVDLVFHVIPEGYPIFLPILLNGEQSTNKAAFRLEGRESWLYRQ